MFSVVYLDRGMIGGDVRVSQFRVRQKKTEGSHVLFQTARRDRPSSLLSSIVLLVKAEVGTDPFLIAAGFRSGILSSLLICVMFLILTQLSAVLFVRTWVWGESYSYSEVWTYTFGSRFHWFPTMLIILAYLSWVVFGGWEMFHYVNMFLPVLWPGVPSILLNKWLLIYGISGCFVLPCLVLISKLNGFRGMAWISLIAHVTGLFCVVGALIRSVGDEGFDPQGDLTLFGKHFGDYIEALGNYNTAFCIHPFIAPIIGEMEMPTIARCYKATWGTNIITGILNFGTGLCSYLLFKDITSYDPVFSYLNPRNGEVIVGIIAMYVVSICTTAFYTYYLAVIIASLTLKETAGQTKPVCLAGLVVVLTYAALNFIGDIVNDISVLVANIAFLLLAFVLPPVFYLVQFGFSSVKFAILALVILFIGVPVGILILYYAIRSLVT
jgi:hypothetical protein